MTRGAPDTRCSPLERRIADAAHVTAADFPAASASCALNLETEPWLFTFDRQGRVAARLEGAFGIDEFRRAVEAALR